MFYKRMTELGGGMTKLQLPKNSAKDFFVELSQAKVCICGRTIGDEERKAILNNAEHYLGHDQQAVLNIIKSCLLNCVNDGVVGDLNNKLKGLRKTANLLSTRYKNNESKLLKAGGAQAEELNEELKNIYAEIRVIEDKLNILESKDDNDESLTEENNLAKAKKAYAEYEKKIASATRTNNALTKKNIIEKIIKDIKISATKSLKDEIIRKTNEKIKRVIVDDDIEIENIDKYIKLKGRAGASEGQTLSIGYCFLGTLFEDAELEFPFIIDSPTGKMDYDKRQAVAYIIPKVFNQMIAFVQSAEVERFADQFYDNSDTQYLTVIASKKDGSVELREGKDFFDKYQREHRGEE